MKALLGVLLLLAGPALAQGTDCRRAATPAERAICADPALRAADAELGKLFATLRAGAAPTVRAALLAGQKSWLRQRDCVGPCLADKIAARRDALRALAATVSDANPGPENTTSVWLTGAWRVGPIRGLGGLEAPARVPGLLRPDTTLHLTPGEACEGSACGDFGLIAQRLADGPGRDGLPALLGVPADTPLLLVLRDGQAAFSLVAAPDGSLFAIANACAPAGDPCGWVRQDWTPLDGGALHRADLAAP